MRSVGDSSNVVFRGLALDANVISRHLSAYRGFCGFYYKTPDERLHRLDFEYAKACGKPEVVVINQEFLTIARAQQLNDYAKAVIVKTNFADQIVAEFIPDCKVLRMPMYTPVTLASNMIINKDVGRAIHIAGSSCMKGTSVVARAWRMDMPNLMVTCSWRLAIVHGYNLMRASPNVNVVWDVSTPSLQMAMRRCEIAVIPSQCEGWSHSIREAMAYGCIVITCDAPPMNEVIRHMHDGILIPMGRARHVPVYSHSMICKSPVRRSLSMLPPPDEIRRAVRMVMAMDIDKRRRISQAAHRTWLRETKSALGKWSEFRHELDTLLDPLYAAEQQNQKRVH